MPRTRKPQNVDAEGNAVVSPMQAAETAFDTARKNYIKKPSAAHYNALMLAARTYQNAYIAEFQIGEK